MITKTKAFTSSDGEVHATLAAAQRAELMAIFPTGVSDPDRGADAWTPQEIVDALIVNADRIKDVLTTKARSRPAARKINGASRVKREERPKRAAHVAADYAKMRAAADGGREAQTD